TLRQTNELTINNISLEHIDPQTRQNGNFGWLGNLLPLDKLLNEQCGDKSFINKLPIYSQSNLQIVNEFLTMYSLESDWQEANQKKWFDFIADKSYNEVWMVSL